MSEEDYGVRAWPRGVTVDKDMIEFFILKDQDNMLQTPSEET